MHPIDIGIVISYIVGCTFLGSWLGSTTQGLKGYFLGESNIPAWAVMLSIVATETSILTFLSIPGVAYKGDLTFLQLPIGYLVGRVLVSVVLLPAYFHGEIYTAYQVLNVRFGGATRTAASILFLISRALGDGLRLFIAAQVLESLAGWGIGISIIIMGTCTIAYTYLGGMKAVIWIDVIQFFVYIMGALIALYLLVKQIPGGWGEIVERANLAHKLRWFNPSFDLATPYTFWAGLIGGMVLNTATHGADQLMVQRYLAARSQRQAAGALIASGVVVFLQFLLFLLIGVSLWVFFQDHPPDRPLGRDGEFTYFIVKYLPVGILGLLVAALFSSAMGTLSGSLNASASSAVNDLYRPLFPNHNDAFLLKLSRLFTIVGGIAQMAVAYAATNLKENVVADALKVAGFVTGIVLGVFLLGVLTKRVGQTSALLGLLAGATTVSYVAFGTTIAWPWWALVGSSTVFVVGLLASLIWPNRLAAEPTIPID